MKSLISLVFCGLFATSMSVTADTRHHEHGARQDGRDGHGGHRREHRDDRDAVHRERDRIERERARIERERHREHREQERINRELDRRNRELSRWQNKRDHHYKHHDHRDHKRHHRDWSHWKSKHWRSHNGIHYVEDRFGDCFEVSFRHGRKVLKEVHPSACWRW